MKVGDLVEVKASGRYERAELLDTTDPKRWLVRLERNGKRQGAYPHHVREIARRGLPGPHIVEANALVDRLLTEGQTYARRPIVEQPKPSTPRSESALTEKTVKVWHGPTSTRSYRSKRAAFDRWAKDLILARCGCTNGYGDFREAAAPYTCPMHAGPLFNAPAWACSNCGAPDSDLGWPCSASDGCGGRHTVPTTLPNSAGYQKLKRRLSRWLQWATTKATS